MKVFFLPNFDPDCFATILGLDDRIEHFEPQFRILHQKLPIWSISEIYIRPAKAIQGYTRLGSKAIVGNLITRDPLSTEGKGYTPSIWNING